MPLLKRLFFIFLLCASGTLYGLPVKLLGHSPSAPNSPVVLLQLDDFISMHRSVVGRTETDREGRFEIELEVERVTLVFVQVGGLVTKLYVEPGQTHSFTTDVFNGGAVTFIQMEREALFSAENQEDINVRLGTFNAHYEQFLADFLPEVNRSRFSGARSYVNSRRDDLVHANLVLSAEEDTVKREGATDFLRQVENLELTFGKLFPDFVEKPFLNAFQEYAVAASAHLAGEARESLFADHFAEQPVDLYHPEYVAALRHLFNGTLLEALNDPSFSELSRAIMAERSAVAAHHAMAHIPMLHDPTLRSAVMIVELRSLYFNARYDKRAALGVLNDMAQHPDVFGEFATVAAHVVEQLVREKPGSPVPDLTFTDTKGREVRLSDFTGRFVLLQFQTEWCRSCGDHVQLIEKLSSRFPRELQVLTVSMDGTLASFERSAKSLPELEWPLVYGPSDGRVHDFFALPAIPRYVLLDDAGRRYVEHLPTPDNGGLRELERILVQFRKEGKEHRKVPGR